jgi:cyclopropane fatty-acyl-phospholipid synthase-like methyltransferase
VLQLGGTTRDLFYYPPRTVQVTVVAAELTPSLWEQAGLQAGVPVRTLKVTSLQALRAAAGSTVDSVVAFDQFPRESVELANEFFQEIRRVLKPGGVFVFIQKIEDGLLPSLVRLGSAGSASKQHPSALCFALRRSED